MDVDPGTDLLAGRYALVERIGQGGMAQVWRAMDQTLQRQVAVKTVDILGEDHEQTMARFRREAIATAGLSDPFVVSVFDAGITDERAYLVMELLDGPSLASLVKSEPPLEAAPAVTMLRQVAQGLGAAHAIGITHRDVKPGNIVLHRGNAKIVDFGIARLTESLGEALTKTATAIGTASYMSPEQALGDPVGPPSDIYALGAVAMAVMTGAPPFTGGSVAVARAHVSDPAPRLRSRRPELPGALDELVAAMLAKDPHARPSAIEVGAALARIGQPGPNRAQPRPAPMSSAPMSSAPMSSAPMSSAPMSSAPMSPGGSRVDVAPPRPGGAMPNPPQVAQPPPAVLPPPIRGPQGPSAPSPSTGQRPPAMRPAPTGPPPAGHPNPPAMVTGGFPPPPPGSVPVRPAYQSSSGGQGWVWIAVAVLGLAALTLLVVYLANL